MSEERRWGIFWRRHEENMRSLVCGSDIDVDSVSTHVLTVSVHLAKKEEAKDAKPTGCPRRRKPLVSSTGRVELVSAGSGSLEKALMVVVMDRPRLGLRDVIHSMGEEPLHEVRIRVLCVFTKQPSAAPRVLRVVQRNSRSGR